MRRCALLLFAALTGSAAGPADLPPVVTGKSAIRVWVDQIGYRAGSRALLIVASDRPLPPAPALELRDAATGQTVWKLSDRPEALRPFNNGAKDGESGDFLAHLDLSDVRMPARGFVAVDAGVTTERSTFFNAGPDVYRESAAAVWKAFYYQRADTEKPEKYAGPWNHKQDHRGPNQAAQARVYKFAAKNHWDPVGTEVLDPTPRDVTGGWWDAGNFSKYMGNTTLCHNDLLLGVQLIGEGAKDGVLKIPESGNGVPDILDEVRWGTEFLIRLADERGAGFGRVHEDGSCPPEADAKPVMLTVPSSGATMNRAAALAYAALVWQEKKLDPAFAKKCLDAALQSWRLLEEKPHPWPPDPRDPKKMANTGDWYVADYDRCRALAAACLFQITADARYDAIVQEIAGRWTAPPPGEGTELYPTLWIYPRAKGAHPELARKMRQMVFASADASVRQTGAARGYAAGIRGYWWGSNRLVGQCGVIALLAAEMTEDPEARRRYLEAAEEYVHYLHGRNPIGLCFLSNMKAAGAERSAMVVFHSWVGKDGNPAGAKYIGEGPGKIGPVPGLVVGGVNGGMKRYVHGLDWRTNPWEFNEPCISYQAPCATLIGYFAWKAAAPKPPGRPR